ncbi:hypothetical protein ACFQZ0_08905 [Streptomyces erythrogriseus]
MGRRPGRCEALPYWRNGTTFTADEELLADYDQLLKRLGDCDLAYLHLVGPDGGAGGDDTLTAFGRFRAHYRGSVVANLGFTRESGNDLIARGLADAVSFGAPYIANPDLVERFAQGLPLAEGDRETYYSGGERGYTDYPAAGRP